MQQIFLNSTQNKLVEDYFQDDEKVIIVFNDGDYIVIEARASWDSSASLVFESFDPYEYSNRGLAIDAGIITQWQLDKFLDDQVTKDRGIADVREKREYERLHRKYGVA